LYNKKIKFYEKNENKKISRAIVISPMMSEKVRNYAAKYGIETYTYPEENIFTAD
jgi:hypothetical protein